MMTNKNLTKCEVFLWISLKRKSLANNPDDDPSCEHTKSEEVFFYFYRFNIPKPEELCPR